MPQSAKYWPNAERKYAKMEQAVCIYILLTYLCDCSASYWGCTTHLYDTCKYSAPSTQGSSKEPVSALRMHAFWPSQSCCAISKAPTNVCSVSGAASFSARQNLSLARRPKKTSTSCISASVRWAQVNVKLWSRQTCRLRISKFSTGIFSWAQVNLVLRYLKLLKHGPPNIPTLAGMTHISLPWQSWRTMATLFSALQFWSPSTKRQIFVCFGLPKCASKTFMYLSLPHTIVATSHLSDHNFVIRYLVQLYLPIKNRFNFLF